LGGADEVLDVFSGGGAGAEDRAEAFLATPRTGMTTRLAAVTMMPNPLTSSQRCASTLRWK